MVLVSGFFCADTIDNTTSKKQLVSVIALFLANGQLRLSLKPPSVYNRNMGTKSLPSANKYTPIFRAFQVKSRKTHANFF